jgi:hypothetical protein
MAMVTKKKSTANINLHRNYKQQQQQQLQQRIINRQMRARSVSGGGAFSVSAGAMGLGCKPVLGCLLLLLAAAAARGSGGLGGGPRASGKCGLSEEAPVLSAAAPGARGARAGAGLPWKGTPLSKVKQSASALVEPRLALSVSANGAKGAVSCIAANWGQGA